MKISALITELQKLQAQHGDLPVTLPFGEHCDHVEVRTVESSDEDFDPVDLTLLLKNNHHVSLS